MILVFLTINTFSQDRTTFDVNRVIFLKSDSEEKKVTIPVDENYNNLKLSIAATIQQGDLIIEIFDPKGAKQGNFSIGCQVGGQKTPKGESQTETSSDSNIMEQVQGRISRMIKNPVKGNWIVKLTPKSARGQVEIFCSQITAEDSSK